MSDVKIDKRVLKFVSKALREQKIETIKYCKQTDKQLIFYYLKTN
jgi:hypothetical protein